MQLNSLINTGSVVCESPKQIQTPSILDNLKRRKMQKEDELNRIDLAIQGLEKNPSVLKVLELIAKA